MTKAKSKNQTDQATRFREAAKKAEAGDANAFERAFKTVVKPKKKTAAKQSPR